MKGMVKFASVLAIFIILPIVSAAPSISNFVVQPQSIWLGSGNIQASIDCSDANYSIAGVRATIIGNGMYLGKDFSLANGTTYSLTLYNNYDIDRKGTFNLTTACANSNNETATSSSSFTVSTISGSISAVSPNPAYTDSIIEIDFPITKDGAQFSGPSPSFYLSVDGQPQVIRTFYFDSNKGWVIKFDSPSSGSHAISLTASVSVPGYSSVNLTGSTTVQVSAPFEFDILSMENTLVKPGDTVKVDLRAYDHGSQIQITKDDLNIWVGSTLLNYNLTKIGSAFEASVIMPQLQSGVYTLNAQLSYNGNAQSDTANIYYVIPVTGRLLDSGNNAIPASIKFSSGSTQWTFTTNGTGYYSGSIPTGTYTVEISFPDSRLTLGGAIINSFDDPVRYGSLTGVDIPGVKTANIFSYAVGFPFSTADILMNYNEAGVPNENSLEVFRCADWNSAAKACGSGWGSVSAGIDTVRNTVDYSGSSLSAFAIGDRMGLQSDFSLDRGAYYLKDVVKVTGMALDDVRRPVPGADVNFAVAGAGINVSTKSDNNGVYTIQFIAPDREGDYNATTTLGKGMYLPSVAQSQLTVSRSKQLSIVMPTSVKVAQNGTQAVQAKLVNTGQTGFDNVSLDVIGIPSGRYSIDKTPSSIKAGEEVSVPITFSAGLNDTPGTFTATLRARSGDYSKEQVFGFTIIQAQNDTPTSSSSTLTGLFLLGSLDFLFKPVQVDLPVLLVSLSLLSFSAAIAMRRVEFGRKEEMREDVKNTLTGIKSEIRRKKAGKKKDSTLDDFVNKAEEPAEEKEMPKAAAKSEKKGRRKSVKDELKEVKKIIDESEIRKVGLNEEEPAEDVVEDKTAEPQEDTIATEEVPETEDTEKEENTQDEVKDG